MERDYAPGVAAHLSDLAGQAQKEEVFWTALVDGVFRRLMKHTAHGVKVAAVDLLAPLGSDAEHPSSGAQEALTRRLIRKVAEEACGAGNFPGAQHVEHVMGLARAGKSGQELQLPHGLRVAREFDRMVFYQAAERGQQPSRGREAFSYEYGIDLPASGTVDISVSEIACTYSLKVIDWLEAERETREASQAIDLASLHAPLILRNWRAGDAYCPAGGRRPRKVSRMLMLRRIPLGQRDGWPVLTSAGEVVWARGLPPARKVTARADALRVLLIQEQRA
jgi:tRNA(Ile)-lysidine synthase